MNAKNEHKDMLSLMHTFFRNMLLFIYLFFCFLSFEMHRRYLSNWNQCYPMLLWCASDILQIHHTPSVITSLFIIKSFGPQQNCPCPVLATSSCSALWIWQVEFGPSICTLFTKQLLWICLALWHWKTSIYLAGKRLDVYHDLLNMDRFKADFRVTADYLIETGSMQFGTKESQWEDIPSVILNYNSKSVSTCRNHAMNKIIPLSGLQCCTMPGCLLELDFLLHILFQTPWSFVLPRILLREWWFLFSYKTSCSHAGFQCASLASNLASGLEVTPVIYLEIIFDHSKIIIFFWVFSGG